MGPGAAGRAGRRVPIESRTGQLGGLGRWGLIGTGMRIPGESWRGERGRAESSFTRLRSAMASSTPWLSAVSSSRQRLRMASCVSCSACSAERSASSSASRACARARGVSSDLCLGDVALWLRSQTAGRVSSSACRALRRACAPGSFACSKRPGLCACQWAFRVSAAGYA